jgi:predicted kinase
MKLIIINGSPATGKSTLALRLHEALPMSLLVDVDAWRRLISGYRENKKESLKTAYKFTIAAIDAYLQTGHDVVVDKAILGANEVLEDLIMCGKKHGANIFELILTADKDMVVQRAERRGYRESGLLTPDKTLELWDKAQALIKERTDAIVIDTNTLDADSIYQKVKDIVLK